MNCLYITEIIKKENTLRIRYDADGEWKKFFINDFFAEYDYNIEQLPDSIAIIPFLANILPIAWIMDATIHVDSIDSSFYNCLKDVKAGYQKMIPQFNFYGNLIGDKVENNKKEALNVGMFFSGGLDSFSSLIEHIEEKPTIMTIWGSDISLDDKSGWDNVKNQIEDVKKNFEIEGVLIKSNFRTFIDEPALTSFVYPVIGDSWWHAFQHGIGIISHAAPICFIKKIGKIYIAASYSKKNMERTCASTPKIDNYIKFANTRIIHDQYEYTRIEKARKVVQYSNEKNNYPKIRVCWISKGGNNCCKCEKCYRTIYELLACNADPNNYGFIYNNRVNSRAKHYILYRVDIDNAFVPFWNEIKEEMIKNGIEDKSLKWIYRVNSMSITDKIIRKIVRKMVNMKHRFLK